MIEINIDHTHPDFQDGHCPRAHFRGQYDLHAGNEAGILGERNPVFAIRKLSATELTHERQAAFESFPGLQQAWTEELADAEGTQNFLNGLFN